MSSLDTKRNKTIGCQCLEIAKFVSDFEMKAPLGAEKIDMSEKSGWFTSGRLNKGMI